MSATPVNPVVYCFEDQLEHALAAHGPKFGVNDPKLQQGTDELKTPRVEFKTVFSGFVDQKYWINQTTGEKWLQLGRGNLYAKVITRRGNAKQNHSLMRGSVRAMLQDVAGISARLQFHSLVMAVEAGTVPDFKQDEANDISILSFQIVMAILPTAFPQN